jgi:hypothetical protein
MGVSAAVGKNVHAARKDEGLVVRLDRGSSNLPVEQHIDTAERVQRQIDERLTVGGLAEIARVHGHHLSTRAANDLDGVLCSFDSHVATDDGRALAGKGESRFTADAAARARDDADLCFKPG